MGKILIVDNDEGLIHFLTRLFVKQGHEVASCTDGISGLERVKAEPFDLILLDYKMPGLNGLETLVEIKNAQIKTPVIVMTAYGTTETAIEAMKLGAYDYLLKPFDTEGLKRLAADALEVNRLMKEIVGLPSSVTKISPPVGGLVRIVGTSPQMQEVFKLIGQVAEKDVGGADHRRERHGQGTGRPGHLSSQPPERQTVHGRQLRDHPRRALRERAVRLRARCVHRRLPLVRRQVRALPHRHALLRRNRRHVVERPRPRCCACFRKESSSGSAARRPSTSTCASWRPRTRTWKRKSRKGGSARTSTTA